MKRLLMHSPIVVAALWIVGYLLLTLLPLLVLLLHPAPSGRGFWIEFSVALGFIGLAMMALQFVIAARVNRIDSSYGIDILLQFHRYTSLAALLMVLAHPAILFIVQPDTLQLLNFPQAPWRARMAVLGTIAFLTMVITTIWRKQLKILVRTLASHSHDSSNAGSGIGLWTRAWRWQLFRLILESSIVVGDYARLAVADSLRAVG
jgi:predicted ferric reductase